MKAEELIAKGEKLVYEDEKVIALLSDKPMSIGHILIFPKEHYANIEDVPEDLVSHLFYVASFAATAVFEGLGAQGTNIIVNSGNGANPRFDRVCLNVLPRKEGDGIDFKWQPKEDLKQQLGDIESQIKGEAILIGKEVPKEEKPVVEEEKTEEVSGKEGEENYLTKQLRRIP